MTHFLKAVVVACALNVLPVIAAPGMPAAETQVGVIGNEQFKFGQLPPDTQTELQETQRKYEMQVHQLALDNQRNLQNIVENHAHRFIDGKVMAQEAQARNVSVEQLAKEIEIPQVSKEQAMDFYEKNKQQIAQPYSAISAQLTQYLQQQETERAKRSYINGLRTKYAARVTLEPLREAVPAEGPSRGPKDARVTIVEFSDFQCPFCGQMAPLLKQVQDKYPKDVRLVYRQLPLVDIHPNSLIAAKAAVCASEQGKFWEMHDAMFADQNALTAEGLKKTAATSHLKTKPFDACLDSQATADAVEADSKAGTEYGVAGTPGLFINGRFFNGAIPMDLLLAVVDDELHRSAGGHSLAQAAATAVPR